jgi:sec-independent protein translocase protein TatB
VFFDLSPFKLLALVILGTIVLGPDKLPGMIAQAARVLRKVRAFAEDAKREIRDELGPEFQDFEFEDLNPRTFVAKNLLADDTLGLRQIRDGFRPDDEAEAVRKAVRTAGDSVDLTQQDPGRPPDRPPVLYDPDAT